MGAEHFMHSIAVPTFFSYLFLVPTLHTTPITQIPSMCELRGFPRHKLLSCTHSFPPSGYGPRLLISNLTHTQESITSCLRRGRVVSEQTCSITSFSELAIFEEKRGRTTSEARLAGPILPEESACKDGGQRNTPRPRFFVSDRDRPGT